MRRAFRETATILAMCPVYVWTDGDVRDHVAVYFLAFVRESFVQNKLGDAASYRQVLPGLDGPRAVPLR